MKYFISDIHIHSLYSRATSPKMTPEILSEYAKIKGIDLLGTGDVLHPEYKEKLKKVLKEKGDGFYEKDGISFVLQTEVSLIYTKNNKLRKIHIVLLFPSFDEVDKIEKKLALFGSLSSDGRPTFGMDSENLIEIVREVSDEIMIIPAHIWTPWFSLFGSNSGFDSIDEAFGKYKNEITALETGLSSDPEMNWMLSSLDNYSLVSNSDSHSPEKIGREANVFKRYLSFKDYKKVLEQKDNKEFLFTIEFFPEEGKYHYDGHRTCKVVFHPEESKRHNMICPVCNRKLTIGVLSRVYSLADRKEGEKPSKIIPFKSLVPLKEIIAQAINRGENTKEVDKIYKTLINKFDNELFVLLEAELEEIEKLSPTKVAEGIENMRKGKVKRIPGYDGVYGIINVFPEEEEKKQPENNKNIKSQMSLF
jgi:uncharacterized protein (TIGR00375 family)